MINGHGDDLYRYGDIRSNFSSNVYNFVDHTGLKRHLCEKLDSIRSYPEPEPYTLERRIEEMAGTGKGTVCVTSGATEAIYLIAQCYSGALSLVYSPTFSEYADACRIHGHRCRSIFSFDALPDTPALVWICNPNNPTGRVHEPAVLERLIRDYPQHVFIIDQSYEMFACKPVLDAGRMARMENVIMLHSMTKCFAVPGIRLGYFTAAPSLVERIRSKRMPWSVNALAIEAGMYLLDHAGEYRPDVAFLAGERARVAEALAATGKIRVFPSDTHYMLLSLLSGTAASLKEFLAAEKHILIRDASNFEGLDCTYFRIAVQTPQENDAFVEGIREWLSLQD